MNMSRPGDRRRRRRELAGFRPEHVELGNGRADGARYDAPVEVVEYLGDEQLVHLRLDDTSLLAKLDIEQQVTVGERRRSGSRRASCTCSTRRPSKPCLLGD